MNLKEKKLYHQIHPLKLSTDWGTGIVSLYFLWYHQLVTALVIMFIPAIIVSFVIIKYFDLEKYKHSTFGKHVYQHMTTSMEVVRFIGFAVAIVGAWFHFVWLIVLGIIIIFIGWLRGFIAES